MIYGARIEQRRAGPATARDNVGKGAGGESRGRAQSPGIGWCRDTLEGRKFTLRGSGEGVSSRKGKGEGLDE